MAESLFSPALTPTDNLDANAGSGISVCTLFIPAVNGTVSHIRRYRSATSPTFSVGSLWSRTSDAAGTLLASGSTWDGGGVGGAPGWDTVPLSGGPVAVTAGATYYAELTTDRFVSDTTASPIRSASVVSGNLTAPQNDNAIPRQNGRFVSNGDSTPTYPNDGLNLGNFYFIDVVFTATAGSTQNAAAAVTGTGAVSTAAAASRPASAAAAATGSVSTAASAARPAAATLTSTAGITTATAAVRPGPAALTATATITTAATVLLGGSASLVATGSITATAAVTRAAAAAFTVAASVSVTAATSGGRITHRPNSGTTARPGAGTTGRPYAGVTLRP